MLEPRRTQPRTPIATRIADDLRIAIELGTLRGGASLPPQHDLAETYGCSQTTVRIAIESLKKQGLIVGGRGKPPTVRVQVRPVVRDSERHQQEKDLVRKPEEERRKFGLAESDMNVALEKVDFNATYAVTVDEKISAAFELPSQTEFLVRIFEHSDKRSGRLEAWSISWLPKYLIEANPDIEDPANKAWPGGTMHQLYTVGIEVAKVVDEVSARMPSTVEQEAWSLTDGIPLFVVRRKSYDTAGRIVEISDAHYPSDRTQLVFHTPLTPWSDNT